jgi:hypothetical protein
LLHGTAIPCFHEQIAALEESASAQEKVDDNARTATDVRLNKAEKCVNSAYPLTEMSLNHENDNDPLSTGSREELSIAKVL